MIYEYEIVPKHPSLPLRCFTSREKKGGFFPPHWHTDIEILFVLQGHLCVTVNGVSHSVKPDEFLIIHTNHIHSLQSENGTTAYMIQISHSFFTENCEESHEILFDMTLGKNTPKPIINNLRYCFEQLCESPLPPDKYQYLHQKSLLYEILHLLIHYFRHPNPVSVQISDTVYFQRLISIAQYINVHFREDLSLSSLSNQYGLAPAYLSRFFKKYMGMNFSSYLEMLRMNYAYEMLHRTSLPILRICEEAGFKNYPVFVKKFKKKYGCTPHESRKC